MFTKDDVAQYKMVDGEQVTLTDAQREAIAAEWNENIVPTLDDVDRERESRLNSSLTVTLSDGDYVIPVSDRSAALAPEAARRSEADGKTRPFPTDKGIVERDAADLDAISNALDTYITGVWRRAAELEAKVADGTIVESDLDEGWP